ncbi:MAG TPA: DUF308 domain-containing protein [Crinalium sp.]|jgi:hypothetical protein
MRVIESETDVKAVNSGWLTTIAVLMIALGIAAIVFPFVASIASTLVFGWIFIFAGIAQITARAIVTSTVLSGFSDLDCSDTHSIFRWVSCSSDQFVWIGCHFAMEIW